eukprot:gnl/MRDRNA2_/MRDRNA2_102927_c0_seq1.p1 gnl/MRDRNA2_/MRDRNA2_102927_c0~~gnl/MRDRNA2_/MRDRNA2_102927_c0_seq1.p1  ORF type:complete len:127 (+),score=18.22 gnl/MRDRNA2_/MRDRNA2_102927_c0_seq1:77-457(+)
MGSHIDRVMNGPADVDGAYEQIQNALGLVQNAYMNARGSHAEAAAAKMVHEIMRAKDFLEPHLASPYEDLQIVGTNHQTVNWGGMSQTDAGMRNGAMPPEMLLFASLPASIISNSRPPRIQRDSFL